MEINNLRKFQIVVRGMIVRGIGKGISRIKKWHFRIIPSPTFHLPISALSYPELALFDH